MSVEPPAETRHKGQNMPTQVKEDSAPRLKPAGLIIVGVLILVAVVYLEYLNVTNSKVTDAFTTRNAKDSVINVTTTVKWTPISDTLLTAGAGLGAVLLLAGAFFGRITKLLLPGGIELDFDTTAMIGAKAVQATGGDALKTKKLTKEATKRATALAQYSRGTADAAGYVKLDEADIVKVVLRTAEDLGLRPNRRQIEAVKRKLA